MAKHLKSAFILTLATLTVAVLTLSVTSYWRIFNWDLSDEGNNWKCLQVKKGAVAVVYVSADIPPGLWAIAPSKDYTRYVSAYSKDIMFEAQLRAARTMYNDFERAHAIRALDKKEAQDLCERIDKEETERRRDFFREKSSTRLNVTAQADQAIRHKTFAGFFINIASTPREVVLRLPLAAFILLFGLAPTLALFHRMRIRSRRLKENLCLTCGYNLTGNLSGTCPECGVRILQKIKLASLKTGVHR